MLENGQLMVLNMRDILPNRFQPRIRFDEEKLEELADSISKYGVIQPIVVRTVGNKFEIIAGERRFKASRLANRSTIPAIVLNLSDKDSEEIALLENVQRQELNPIEEAVSYKRILDMGYITQEELSRKIGKSQSTIANKIRLLNLDDEVQSYLLNNKISERHARSLLRISDKEKQVEMLHRIVEERLTVKQTDKEIAKIRETEKSVKPVDLNIPVKKNVQPVVNPVSKSEEIESLFDDDFDKNEGGDSMDIDRIMREAKDINSASIPEAKDISNLMVPGEMSGQPVNQPMPEVQPVEEMEAKKFINVESPTETPKQVEHPVNNTVTFDSMFNQHVTPVATPEGQVMSNTQPTPSINDSSSIPAPSVTPNVSLVESMSTPSETVNDFSTMPPTINNNVVSSTDSSMSEVSGDNNVSSIPEISNVDVNNLNVGPNIYSNSESDDISLDTKKSISSAVASALKKYHENKARQSLANTIPSPTANVTPSVNNVNTVNIPDMDIIASDTLNEYSNKNVQPTMASTISQDVKPVNNQVSFANVVKMLRDCADRIEQNGYFVNMDELDLGNQYKVTFTINKE